MLLELFTKHNERTKGTTDLHLTVEGIESAHKCGMQFSKKRHDKPITAIYCNDLIRSFVTAKIIQKYNPAQLIVNNALYPWHMGFLEGKTIKESKPLWMDYVINKPNTAIPGRGPQSQYDGESFNTFKIRWLTFLSKQMMEMNEIPNQIKIFVTHSRNENVTHGWFTAGAKPNFEIVPMWMAKKPDPPTSAHRFSYINGEFFFNEYPLLDLSDLPYGLYLVRHGSTSWNG